MSEQRRSVLPMHLSQHLVEAPPALRWHTSRVLTRLLHRQAFGHIGQGTVIVRPHRLSGVDEIYIGNDCAIYEGVWLACEPGAGPLRIGDNNYFGHQVHVHALDPVTIGSDCVFADGVFIGSSDHDRSDRHAVAGSGAITIGNRVFLGQRSVVLGSVTIGEGATVGAHAVVTRNVRPGATVVGIPAREVGAS